mgnify:CR=1 FL=1
MNNKNIRTREDFILFLRELDKDFKKFIKKNDGNNKYKMEGTWENIYIGDFLESIASWMEDSKKYKKQNLSWKDLADIIESGKFYE